MFSFVFCLLCCFVQDGSDLEAALLASTVESQKAVEADSRSEILMHRSTLDLAKNAVIKTNVRNSDQFGSITDGRYYMPNKKIQAQAVEFYRAKLVASERRAKDLFEEMVPIIDVQSLSKGKAGFLGTSLISLADVRVLQVLGDSSFLGVVGRETILFRGASTENVTDGKVFRLSNPVEVLGTERYTTAVGSSNTVFCVRIIPKDDFRKAMVFVDENKLKFKPSVRDWCGVNGIVIVRGEYISHDKLFVVVKNTDGIEEKLSMSKLSRDDKAWLKDR